jgi:hypothetical protein
MSEVKEVMAFSDVLGFEGLGKVCRLLLYLP